MSARRKTGLVSWRSPKSTVNPYGEIMLHPLILFLIDKLRCEVSDAHLFITLVDMQVMKEEKKSFEGESWFWGVQYDFSDRKMGPRSAWRRQNIQACATKWRRFDAPASLIKSCIERALHDEYGLDIERYWTGFALPKCEIPREARTVPCLREWNAKHRSSEPRESSFARQQRLQAEADHADWAEATYWRAVGDGEHIPNDDDSDW